ncbi:hypothetical protein QJS04_geneDACA008379 [Acorus gramineus]|uniref:Mitochondrial import inner membrane translocase subunit TIM50 n=1 Tax=Acorus gramineus TaxID=55184 RepID=A0AAV9AHM3_ACOGR|nr:hypothetical protein QJS04_geneDACA008379 [Acorus gramineus]
MAVIPGKNRENEDDIERLPLVLERLKITDSKKLLVLDLNGLLVHTFTRSKKVQIPNSRSPDGTIGRKVVFKRPFCDEFLRFCFQRFDVGIWSSAQKFLQDQSDCTNTGMKTIEDRHKPLFLKELKKIWDNQSCDLPWSKGRYTSSNTLLIDDSPYKSLLNPPNSVIFPSPYAVEHVDDDGLGLGGELRVFLDGLAEAEDIPSYVASHPFGQPAITDADPNWDFYSEIIHAFSNDQ